MDVPKKRVTRKRKSSTENKEGSEIIISKRKTKDANSTIKTDDGKINIMEIPKKMANRKRKSTTNKGESEIIKPKRVKISKLGLKDDTSTATSDISSKPPNKIKSEEYYDENMWTEAAMLSDIENVPKDLANGFINLLNEGCTLPFIARYRKGMVNNLMPDRLV